MSRQEIKASLLHSILSLVDYTMLSLTGSSLIASLSSRVQFGPRQHSSRDAKVKRIWHRLVVRHMLHTAKLEHGLRQRARAIASALLLLVIGAVRVKSGCLRSDLLAGGGPRPRGVCTRVLYMRPGFREGQLGPCPALAALLLMALLAQPGVSSRPGRCTLGIKSSPNRFL